MIPSHISILVSSLISNSSSKSDLVLVLLQLFPWSRHRPRSRVQTENERTPRSVQDPGQGVTSRPNTRTYRKGTQGGSGTPDKVGGVSDARREEGSVRLGGSSRELGTSPSGVLDANHGTRDSQKIELLVGRVWTVLPRRRCRGHGLESI